MIVYVLSAAAAVCLALPLLRILPILLFCVVPLHSLLCLSMQLCGC